MVFSTTKVMSGFVMSAVLHRFGPISGWSEAPEVELVPLPCGPEVWVVALDPWEVWKRRPV